MTPEQKARAYDKLLIKAKQIYNKENDVLIIHTLEDLLPELKESEDEKTRKRVIALVNAHGQGMYKDDMLTWLEKQGEQKPVEWKQENVEELSEFENAMMHIGYSFFGKRGGLDPNDTSSVKVQAQYLLELAQKPAWSEEDEKQLNDIIELLPNLTNRHNWLKSLKDRVQPEQEWNEEDEKMLNSFLHKVEVCNLLTNKENVWIVKKLKSLKPQPHWKPSDKQMKFLQKCIEAYNEVTFPTEVRVLSSLYNDLKKLKGE